MTTASTEGDATSVPLGGLFTPEHTPGFCFVCEAHREAPMVCGPTCIADLYPRKDTNE